MSLLHSLLQSSPSALCRRKWNTSSYPSNPCSNSCKRTHTAVPKCEWCAKNLEVLLCINNDFRAHTDTQRQWEWPKCLVIFFLLYDLRIVCSAFCNLDVSWLFQPNGQIKRNSLLFNPVKGGNVGFRWPDNKGEDHDEEHDYSDGDDYAIVIVVVVVDVFLFYKSRAYCYDDNEECNLHTSAMTYKTGDDADANTYDGWVSWFV